MRASYARRASDARAVTDRPVLCCPDKFRGSLTALEAAEALALGVERTGRPTIRLPLADGGEGGRSTRSARPSPTAGGRA